MARKVIRLSFTESDQAKLDVLADLYKLPDAKSLVRYLITRDYDKVRDTELKYGKSTRLASKEQTDEAIATLEKMSDEEATEFLNSIGYLEDPELFNTTTGEFQRAVIKTKENGSRMLTWEYYNPETEEVSSFAETMTLAQVINELKKQKLI